MLHLSLGLTPRSGGTSSTSMDKGLPDQQDRSLCMQEGLQVWQFREGGGHYTCLMLPIFAGHKRRHVLRYAVRGICPILIGRPLLEKLGLMVDFSTRQYRWEGQQWKPVILGRKNGYLIRLAENYKELIREEPEVLIPDDHEEHIDFTRRLTLKLDHILVDEPGAEPASSYWHG